MAYSHAQTQQMLSALSDTNQSSLNRDDMIAEVSSGIDMANQLFDFQDYQIADDEDTQRLVVSQYQSLAEVRDGLIRLRNELFDNEGQTITDSQREEFKALWQKFDKFMTHMQSDVVPALDRANHSTYGQYTEALKEA